MNWAARKIQKILAAFLTLVLFASPLSTSASVRVVDVITSGSTWAVPDNFNSYDNIVEVIGGGGGAGRSSNAGAGGGGGGAYAKTSNVNLIGTSSVFIQVGSGGPGGTGANTAGTAGGDTFFMR